MKNARPLAALGLALAQILLAGCTSNRSKAQQLEAQADYPAALELYIAETQAHAPSLKYPDKNEAKILKPGEYYRKIGDYLAWVAPHTPVRIAPEVEALLQGVDRCASKVEPVNYLIEVALRPAAAETLAPWWENAFFPEGMRMPATYEAMMQEAISRSMSMLTIRSGAHYSYKGFLIDRAAGRATAFFLYADNQISFFVKPGKYYLMCKSEKTFSMNQRWESPMSAFPIAIPPAPSLLSAKIMTRIKRNAP